MFGNVTESTRPFTFIELSALGVYYFANLNARCDYNVSRLVNAREGGNVPCTPMHRAPARCLQNTQIRILMHMHELHFHYSARRHEIFYEPSKHDG